MEIAFADAAYYIGLLLPNDELHDTALRRKEELQDALVVTHDGVLVEVLAHVSQMGAFVRLKGVGLVQDVRADHRIQVIEQTRELFDAGLALYAARLDKGYSLTDCMSMVVCRDLGIDQVLSHDHHFAQEGLAVLL